jgi:hypothetical protein
VPITFVVGECVDFITRLSKLDKYSDRTTSRSLERIFVTGALPTLSRLPGSDSRWSVMALYAEKGVEHYANV